MTARNLVAAALLASALAVGACGPGQQEGPQGVETPADVQSPVPEQPGFPGEPVMPTPRETIETAPPAPDPTALPTP